MHCRNLITVLPLILLHLPSTLCNPLLPIPYDNVPHNEIDIEQIANIQIITYHDNTCKVSPTTCNAVRYDEQFFSDQGFRSYYLHRDLDPNEQLDFSSDTTMPNAGKSSRRGLEVGLGKRVDDCAVFYKSTVPGIGVKVLGTEKGCHAINAGNAVKCLRLWKRA